MFRVPITLGALLLAALVGLSSLPVVAAEEEDHRGQIDRVLELTNAERQASGLPPLALNSALNDAAQAFTQVLAEGTCFEHTCGMVPNFADRLGQAGYTSWTAIGENIAVGYPTPEAVVAGWMASSGHRANILSPSYHELGVGVIGGGGSRTYWTQEFGTRLGTTRAAASPPDSTSAAPAAGDAAPDPGEEPGME